MTTKNTTLGDYALIKQLGAGSLGSVYFAEHRFLKHKVVLKVLPEELSQDRNFIQRFEDDVKILAGLDHPNIVKIHNVSFASGAYFLVTDCVVDEVSEATNLGQYLSGGKKISEDELLRLLKGLASALDYAHTPMTGKPALAHRGLKLSNIFVGKGKNGVELFLSDFGLSRIIGAGPVLARTYRALLDALSGTANQTPGSMPLQPQDRYFPMIGDPSKISLLQASFLQTFAFLAPEQKRLDRFQEVGPKADVYAFGALVYFLITRQYPEGVFDLVSEKCPDYRLKWDELIMKCMRQDPSKRPDRLLPLIEQLENVKTPSTPSSIEQVNTAASTKTSSSIAEQIEERIRSEWVVTHYKQQVNDRLAIDPLLTDTLIIEGGSYMRGCINGSRDELPRHRVVVKSFALDIHPVTNEQFARYLEYLGGEKDDNNHDIIRLRESRIRRVGGKLTIESGYGKHPVVGVTWYGARAYAEWIGRRLPTEAEWEIAAYGGNENNIYPTGEDIEKSQANFFSSDTTSVMSYSPNGLGFYDMAGNVYEWCQDWYDYAYYEHSAQEPNEPKGPPQGVYRVLRGGCWKSLKEDLRCSHRHRNNPGTVNRTYGFRCASDTQ